MVRLTALVDCAKSLVRCMSVNAVEKKSVKILVRTNTDSTVVIFAVKW